MTRVVIPGALRQYTGGAAHLDLPMADGATLADLLGALETDQPRLARRVRDEQGQLRRFVNVYIDGEDARLAGELDAPVPTGAEVLILPSVAGG